VRRVVLCLVGLFIAGYVYGQTPAANDAAPAPSARPPLQKMPTRSHGAKPNRYKPSIPLTAAVVTVNGVCAKPQNSEGSKEPAKAPTAPCRTVISRGQIDAMLEAVDPNASSTTHQQFALNYARLLGATQIAEEQHLDLKPDVLRAIQVQQKMARMQVLTDALMQKLEQKAAHVPATEVEAYYRQNASTFEQADVRRLSLPLSAPTESGKSIDPAAAKAKMEELRTRAIAGENFADLQAAAYKEFAIKTPVPRTYDILTRRGSLAPEEQKVFDMDLSGVTPVFENEGVLNIVKVTSRRPQPLEDVRTQIVGIMLSQRMQEQLSDATKGITAEFNLKYMDSRTQPELFPPSVMSGALHRSMLSSMHVQPGQAQ
jgi:PPIC-type PPIASE domain